jgi:hypothetical protein
MRSYLVPHAVVQIRDATIIVKDGGSRSAQIKIGEGDLTFSEKKTIEYMPDRGILDEVREGDDVPLEVSVQGMWTYIQGTTQGAEAVREILWGLNGAVSTSTDTCQPYSCDIEITLQPPCTGFTKTIKFPEFRAENVDFGVRGSTFSFSGKCNTTRAIFEDGSGTGT